MCEKSLLELVTAGSKIFRAKGHYGGAEGPAQGLQQVPGRGQRLLSKCYPAPGGVRTHPSHQVPVPPSVADPGYLSRILIFTQPRARISDPETQIQKQQQQRGVRKKIVVIHFFVATSFTKCKIILFLNC